jgi:putative membrane protein insertion efficiency factor
VWCALVLLRAYKLLVSPYFTGSCRFVPSCSDYARDAVLEHGALGGAWLALRRLGRCHPFGSAGYDPVPRGVQPTASPDR